MGSWFTVALDGSLKLEHAVLAFEEFPDESHSGKNIAKWLKATMAMFSIEKRDVILFSPDGASCTHMALLFVTPPPPPPLFLT